MAGATPSSGLAEAFALCVQQVQREDPDRAVALLFADTKARRDLAALYAFDLETASVRERVSQPLPGEIRLQWWRDQIEGSHGQNAEDGGSPVAMALIDTIRRHDLPLSAFERLLEARVFDLYEDPMPSREHFEGYAGETASTVMMLAAMILAPSAAPGLSEVAGHAGVAQLCAGVLQQERRHSRRGQVFIPADLLAAAGFDRTSFLAGERDRHPVREALAALGREHWSVVDGNWPLLPRHARPAFLPVRLVPDHLSRLSSEKRAPDVLLVQHSLRRIWSYWRAMRVPETKV